MRTATASPGGTPLATRAVTSTSYQPPATMGPTLPSRPPAAGTVFQVTTFSLQAVSGSAYTSPPPGASVRAWSRSRALATGAPPRPPTSKRSRVSLRELASTRTSLPAAALLVPLPVPCQGRYGPRLPAGDPTRAA